MLKNIAIVSAIVASLVSVPAYAKKELDVKRTVYELSDFPELETKANGVCTGKANLSDKLKKACEFKAFPSVTKAGAFRNVGIGAELNALIRQP